MDGSVEDLASKSLSITSLFAHVFPVHGLILQTSPPPPATKTGPLSKIHARPKTEITQKLATHTKTQSFLFPTENSHIYKSQICIESRATRNMCTSPKLVCAIKLSVSEMHLLGALQLLTPV